MPIRRPRLIVTAALACLGASAWAFMQPEEGGQPDMGQMLINGLMETDGCLGVDAGNMRSGKNAIFAWFEDAEAARRWYNHPTHVQMLRMTGTNPEGRKPLAHVPEDTPVMVIASLTFSQAPEIKGIPMPISQISIELYAPLPGGAMVNGRMAPDAFEVEHMRNLSADGPYGADGKAVPSK